MLSVESVSEYLNVVAKRRRVKNLLISSSCRRFERPEYYEGHTVYPGTPQCDYSETPKLTWCGNCQRRERLTKLKSSLKRKETKLLTKLIAERIITI